MAGITLENDRITYYGNPAGYRQKDTAVVDCIFRCDELTAFLDSRGLTPKWTEGVMERLLAGAHMGGENAHIDVDTSVRGLVDQVNAYTGKGGHHFVDYKGDTIAW